jgi:transposase
MAQFCHWVVEIVLPPSDSTGFQVVPKRWIVERTFAELTSFEQGL